MRVNILQHTPNEGPGTIQDWAHAHGHAVYIYHPATFGRLPQADETDMLVILGSPQSPNDDLPWVKAERDLIRELLAQNKPLIGACFGAQQIAYTQGARVHAAPHKEVGWAPVYLQTDVIPGLPATVEVLHWHQEMFEIPRGAKLLFSSDLVANQGFLLKDNVIGLQFHFEPTLDNVREIAINDATYPDDNNDLHQTAAEIIAHGVPAQNRQVMFQLLDYLVSQK